MKTLDNFFINLIRFYQKSKSFLPAGRLLENGCRFIPSCSEYTLEAIQRYGTIKGSFLGLSRVVRCHPFTKGGADPLK